MDFIKGVSRESTYAAKDMDEHAEKRKPNASIFSEAEEGAVIIKSAISDIIVAMMEKIVAFSFFAAIEKSITIDG